MKEYFLKHKLKIAVGFLIFVVAIPIIINCLFKFSSPCKLFAAEWEAGDALDFYATMLGSVATIVGVYLSIDAAQKNYHEDEINKVKPYLALTHYKSKSRITLGIGTNEDQQKREKHSYYEEYKLTKIYIVVSSKTIEFRDQLDKSQADLLQSSGLGWEVTGSKASLKSYRLISMPFDIENVGNGAALNTYICFSKKGNKFRGMNVFTLKVGQSFYCHIFSSEQDDSILGEYILKLAYEDILGNKYSQEYNIEIKANEKTGGIKELIDLTGKQEKISK